MMMLTSTPPFFHCNLVHMYVQYRATKRKRKKQQQNKMRTEGRDFARSLESYICWRLHLPSFKNKKEKKKKTYFMTNSWNESKGWLAALILRFSLFFLISLLRVRFDVKQNSSFPFFFHLCCFYCFFSPVFCPVDVYPHRFLWGVWSAVTFLYCSKRHNSSSKLLVAVRSHKYKWSRPSQKFSPRDLSDARVVSLFFFFFFCCCSLHIWM